ncbi:MAG: glycosyltransferase family 4 protein [Chloroflexi bacterium]|nr:glycosyltransferase family 4 protein [Chloroflexota bacterium]
MKPARGRPLKMYTTHEHWLICPTHVLWKFNSRTCEKPECFKCSLVSKKPPQLWRYTSMLADAGAHVDKFVSPSRYTAQMHAQRGFPYPVEQLPYFIDRADDDWQNPAPRPHPRPYFLFVGRLERIKGLDTLIHAWRHVGDIDLLVAGEGTYGETLRALAANDPRIKFLGALPQRDLGGLYYHALAVLVPSLTVETFGIILIEAFARKTPVIVRDLGALPEVVQDSRGGFVFRTEAELIDALGRLASNAGLRAELGANGYNAFVRWWSREAHLEMYMNMLRTLALEKLQRVPWEDSNVNAAAFPHAQLLQDPKGFQTILPSSHVT